MQLVYRDPVRMLKGFIQKFAKVEEFCWRWASTPEPPTANGEEVIEHPSSALWWKEQAAAAERMGGSLLALQLYSDDTTLNNKRSRSAYPVYCVPVNGAYDLYKLLFPTSVVAYMPVLTCPLKGAQPPHLARPHAQCARGATQFRAFTAASAAFRDQSGKQKLSGCGKRDLLSCRAQLHLAPLHLS